MSQPLRRTDVSDGQAIADRLTDKEFARVAKLVSDYVGIKLPAAKRIMVEGRLRKRMRALGHERLKDYCAFLFDGGGLESEFVHLIDAVTTNKTDFFRESEHFSFLANEIVPQLMNLRRAGGRTLIKLWSAAGSTGAEAYTMAMVMAELAARRRELDFEVLGTDISTEVLGQAVLGIYPKDMITPVPAEMCRRYVMRGHSPKHRDDVRIVPELRRRVRFMRLNLVDDKYPLKRDMDVIFLRNVLIYFDRATQEAVTCRMIDHLRPGGFLILGHSESVIGSGLKLRQWAPAIFQRA
jgi:chemotaxis protein methyltransferase CheR